MVNQTSLLTVEEITSTSLTLSWKPQINAFLGATSTGYNLSCEASYRGNLTTEEVNTHKVSYTLRGTTRQMINGLIPNTRYNCCIANNGDTIDQCTNETTSSTAGLTAASAGVLGAFLGALITVIVALVVVAIVVSVLIAVKKQRAAERAKSRPVLRTDSKRFNRQATTRQPDQDTQLTPPHASTLPHSHASTLPHSRTSMPAQRRTKPLPVTPLTQQPPPVPKHKKSHTAPRMKPAVPLKPPIKATSHKQYPPQQYPLRRARSQPDTFQKRVEQSLSMDDDHIYDDAEIFTRSRRIESRENVAYYSQANLDDNFPTEYDALY